MREIQFQITAFIIFLFATSVFSQESFEGKVSYKIITAEGTTVMDYFIKDNFIKMDVGAEKESASMIFDTKESKMIIIMPDQRTYMEMPVKLNDEMKNKTSELKGEFKETGEKKDILGYSCEQWVYKDDSNEIESWMTKELGSFVFMANPMDNGGSKPEWQKKLEQGGYFPLSVIVKEGSDGKETRMEVTNVEKKSLDIKMFTPPAGYQKLEMPGMD